MPQVNDAACDTGIRIEKAGGYTIRLPQPVECGTYAVGAWYLTDDDETIIVDHGILRFNGTLTSFFVELQQGGILKYFVMRVLALPPAE